MFKSKLEKLKSSELAIQIPPTVRVSKLEIQSWEMKFLIGTKSAESFALKKVSKTRVESLKFKRKDNDFLENNGWHNTADREPLVKNAN